MYIGKMLLIGKRDYTDKNEVGPSLLFDRKL
jgi:hypothetical protein